MTAEPTGHVMWSPNPLRQRLANYFLEDVLNLPDDAGVPSPFEIKLPIREITP
jgi:hypothetical protein